MMKRLQIRQYLPAHHRLLFTLISVFVFSLLMDKGVWYRSAGYCNLVYWVYHWCMHKKWRMDSLLTCHWLLFFPLLITILDSLSSGKLGISSDANQFILAIFATYGCYRFVLIFSELFEKAWRVWLLVILLTFFALQVIYFVVSKDPWGSFNNPHYLALSVALLIPVVIYALRLSQGQYFFAGFYLLSLVGLTGMLLYTSSRPTWIGVIMAMIFCIFEQPSKVKWQSTLGFGLILVTLLVFDVGHFASRFSDLLMHITTEERAFIWQDAWQMQLHNTTVSQWLIGHGLDSYKNDFITYSSYYIQEHIDFGSPHNWVLEILYLSGISGLVALVTFLVYVWCMIRRLINSTYRSVGLILASMYIITVIMGFLTVKVFAHYPVFYLSLILAVALALNRYLRFSRTAKERVRY